MSLPTLLAVLPLLLTPASDQTDRDTRSIGASREGRPLEMIVLADPIERADERPGILVVAGLDGRHRSGTALARGIAEQLRSHHADLLDSVTFYILPLVNPDGAAGSGRSGNARVVDRDRDGFLDENGPSDLDGDGHITLMRRADPPLDDPPTHCTDPADPRLMIRPDRAQGERATHSLHVEGLDTDGDGLIAEDGLEGVDLDRNFPHLWPEHSIDSGPYPLSEYETRALATFVIEHPNLIAAVVYGAHDNLVREPDSKSMDITGRTPKELAAEDRADHEQIRDRYRELVGQARSGHAGSEGSLHAWLYAHRGLPTYASTLWGRPDPAQPSDETTEATEGAAEPRDPEEAAWLAYSDGERDGDGFIEWTPFEHPQLGPVEIGGWVPGFRETPPEEVMADLTERHTAFIADLAQRRYRLEFRGPEIEPLPGGLARVRLGITNTGATPTRSHQAVRTRAGRPLNVRLGIAAERLLSGDVVEQVERIEPGELVILEWTFWTPEDERVDLQVEDPVLGETLLHAYTSMPADEETDR